MVNNSTTSSTRRKKAGMQSLASPTSSPSTEVSERLIAYLRVSTAGQVVDGYGLDAQETAIRQYVANIGGTITEVIRDEGVSGTLPAHERPGLMQAIGLLGGGEADALVIARLDRLARDLTTQEAILAQCWALAADVHSADLGLIHEDDPDDPMRTAMRQMVGVFAQLDRALVIKRLRDGRRAKVASGGKGSGSYPYGWDRHGEVASEQRVLTYVRRLRNMGQTWQAIADDLNAEGLVPRTAPRWTAANVAKGTAHAGRRATDGQCQTTPVDSHPMRRNP